MYLSRHFRETRREVIDDFMRAHPFASVVANAQDGLAGNHLPLELGDGVLRGHIARGNELGKLDGAPVLVMFHGPDAYISPNWYPSKHEHGREVPTWNYAAVHVHGHLRVIDDASWMRAFLHALTTRHEMDERRPWSIDDAPVDYIEKMSRAVLGIEIPIERIDAKFKLDQRDTEANRRGEIDGLRQRRRTHDVAVAELITKTLSDSNTTKS